MIQEYTIKNKSNKELSKFIIDSWKVEENKVFHLKNNIKKNKILSFYENLGNTVGSFKKLAEDVKLGDRSSQQANKIWTEVRV